MKQQTFEREIELKGVGLHSGLENVMKVKPAAVDTGIVFLQNGERVRALYSAVNDTRNCTCLKGKEAFVSTIEHVMAGLYALGVDNACIDVLHPELPIMDGSADVLLKELSKGGIQTQNENRKYLRVLKPVRFCDDKENFVELKPTKEDKLHIYFKIEFPSKIVGTQVFDKDITFDVFRKEIAPARTFCEKYQVDYLKSIGLIKGGSLENAVVLDGENILNPEGFRVKNECVNHKVLDLIGDLYTSGFFIYADIQAYRTGHFHNNEVLKKLFENKENYEIL